MKNSATLIKLLILALFIGGIVIFFALGGQKYLNLEALKENRDALIQYADQHYVSAIVIGFLIYTLSTALSLPGGLILSLAVGLVFGRWAGTVVIVLAGTLGATLVFLAARYLFADLARNRMGGLAQKINEGFTKDAFNYLLFLRLVPLFPFWLVNLAPAFTNVSFKTYVIATAIGILPGSFVFANLGQSLGRISSTKDLLTPPIIGAFVLLGVFALIPVLYKKHKARA
ncbi:MAG: TVP38/TMEM64 family protein [Pseudomonadota bacterium]|nr:TVP38/TMEM64 family protein [Pseudomonadota bacterium]